MKYTNIKKLLIKFMGGGLINFPTRFLRWIKIDGDAEGDDGGGDSGGGDDSGNNGYMFFGPAAIQPEKYLEFNEETEEYSDVKYVKDLDYNLLCEYFEDDIGVNLLYTKEELTKLGISLSELEQLEAYDISSNNVEDYIEVNENIFENNFIIQYFNTTRDGDLITNHFTAISIDKFRPGTKYIIRYNINGDDNIYMIHNMIPGGGGGPA